MLTLNFERKCISKYYLCTENVFFAGMVVCVANFKILLKLQYLIKSYAFLRLNRNY